MRLSKLKLAGFKSFVDPVTILTPGQLVGIVGPNGCGKSNVIDAVRWVLGESRASALRGESMQDVIFNGSTTRKAVSRASVEMIFDNAQGRAAGPWRQYAEISVRRQVDRSGNSEYFINNVVVRRKDVIDLFLGTGLGPKAYAIIEQGMISRVIEARPEEVRAFLEEAAGITRYKERRRETEGRLADARDNLARVEDIRAELGQQIERLSVQAELARKHKALSAEMTQKQILLWRLRHALAEREQTALAEALALRQREIDAFDHARHEAGTAGMLAREAQAAATDALSAAQAAFYEISAEQGRIESELRSIADARTRLGSRSDGLYAETLRWQQQRASAVLESQHWSERLAETEEQLEHAGLQAEEAEEGLPEAETHWRQCLARQDSMRARLNDSDRQISVEDTRCVAARRAIESLAQRHKRLDAEREAMPLHDPQALVDLESAIAALGEARREAGERLGELQQASASAQQQLDEARRAAQTAERELTDHKARHAALLALQQRLRSGDLAAWLEQAGLAGLSPLWECLQVEPGWALALESVLRERIGALGPLEASAQWLAQAAPVMQTLLIGGAQTSSGKVAPLAPMAGLPLLAEQVSCQRAELLPLIRAWLGGVHVVDSLDDWLAKAHELPPGVRLVSREGHVLAADALSLYAPDTRTHGAVERQQEIDALAAALPPMTLAVGEAGLRVEAAQAAVLQGQAALAEARRESEALQHTAHERQISLLRLQQAHAQVAERSTRLDAEFAELARLGELEAAHEREAAQALEHLREQREAWLDELESEADATREAEHALKHLRDALGGLQRRRHEIELAVHEARSRHDAQQRNQTLADAQLEKLAQERETLDGEQAGLDDGGLELALRTALDLRRERERQLQERRQQLDGVVLQIRQLDESHRRAEQSLGPLREAQTAQGLKHQAAELAAAQALERLAEMGVAFLALEPAVLAGLNENALNRDLARLGRELSALGAVNAAALVELESARERKQYLDLQNEDLSRAITTLEDAIRRIDRDTREQLGDTYRTVNRHFGELFPRLFGGGQAQLVLTGDELLDSGVQIVAQPPGKKNASIHLLSGGEKALTAIALVFAMFQLNPAPFCMLDEVDAPLDDTNTERYCEMVRHMSAVTQFIFISHSKLTMEMGQQLVGVTMQEQGVSRIVEVDVESALKLAQHGTA